MLILGLQMHGIFGNNEKYVRIPKSDINKWHKKFSESDDVGKFNFRMKTKGGEQMSMKDSKMRP